jgi:hypothetical protein
MSLGEEHYSVQEFAKMLNCSRQKAARILQRYQHLIPNLTKKSRSRFGPIKRPYHSWQIPRSVAERIYRDLIGDDSHAV